MIRNITFGLELHSVPTAERKTIAEKYIAEIGLVGFERKYPHELSINIQQRIGLTHALTMKANVLLMDEPFSTIDEQTQHKLQEDMLQLITMERKTFVFITHSIEEAVYLSDRIVLLSPHPDRV